MLLESYCIESRICTPLLSVNMFMSQPKLGHMSLFYNTGVNTVWVWLHEQKTRGVGYNLSKTLIILLLLLWKHAHVVVVYPYSTRRQPLKLELIVLNIETVIGVKFGQQRCRILESRGLLQ